MKIKLDILRRKNQNEQPYHQIIEYEIQDENTTLAAALTDINSRSDIKDMEGKPVGKIRWECSCMQKKCGACAMVINSVPRLACDTKLSEFQKKGKVTVEPLRKFPVIADLAVDRSILFENLKTLKLWLNEAADLPDNCRDTAYEASECLQCGCCLEVCPNFYVGGVFFGILGRSQRSFAFTRVPVLLQCAGAARAAPGTVKRSQDEKEKNRKNKSVGRR